MGCGTSKPKTSSAKQRRSGTGQGGHATIEENAAANHAAASLPTPEELGAVDSTDVQVLDVPAAVRSRQSTSLLVDEVSGKWRRGVAISEVYSIGRVLGRGGFATVRVGTDKRTGEAYAIKIMVMPKQGQKESHNDNTWKDVLAEIAVLASLDHPNVITLKEYYVQADTVYLVTNLVQGGELLDALLDCGTYSELTARQCFRQVLEGIQYLHANGIAHRDLKLENLLLKVKGDITQLCIVDFGLAKRDITHAMQMDTVCGTPQFVAPEVIAGTKATMYGLGVDIWSAGVILYILLSGDPPFYHKEERMLFNLIRRGTYGFQDPVWDLISDKAKNFISNMLVVDPKQRLSASEALKHPWMVDDLPHGYELSGARENMREMRKQMHDGEAPAAGALN